MVESRIFRLFYISGIEFYTTVVFFSRLLVAYLAVSAPVCWVIDGSGSCWLPASCCIPEKTSQMKPIVTMYNGCDIVNPNNNVKH